MSIDYPPTAEQQTAIEAFSTGLSVALDALAGTGKTSTLEMLGASTRRLGAYMAFNKSIAQEAALRMPPNVVARTVHSYAYRAVGNRFARRIRGSARMNGSQLARVLGVDPYVVSYGSQRKVLQPSFLAGHVMKAVKRFCQTADDAPGRRHIAYIDGIDLPEGDGTRTWENNDRIRDLLEPLVVRAWADLSDPDGGLPFHHDAYLKLWAAGDPQLGVEFLMVDEAQDLSPVMLQIAEKQRDCQLVLVGDANQSIYGWRGSINAMDVARVDARATLTQSFRFGPPVAGVANWCLGHLPTDLRVRGYEKVTSRVGPVGEPAAVLCRTNAGSLEVVFDEQERGRRPFLMGGGTEVAAFARGARDLQQRGQTGYPDLACFDSWSQVREYCENDPQGDELALMVRLVDDYGVDTILTAVDGMGREDGADVVVSTAHKAKGRQWPTVQLHGDFRKPDEGVGGYEEWRLLYVAVTRAQEALDVTPCPAFAELLAPPRSPRPAPIALPPAAHERPVVEPERPAGPEPAAARSESAQALLDLLR
jgi:hypothetical protein